MRSTLLLALLAACVATRRESDGAPRVSDEGGEPELQPTTHFVPSAPAGDDSIDDESQAEETDPGLDPRYTFAVAVELCGDLDRDGCSEFAVGSPMERTDGKGRVYVYSGSDGLLLRALTGPPEFGGALANLGDVDGDEIPDLAVGASCSWLGNRVRGSVDIVSGADGTLIRRVLPRDGERCFGSDLSVVGDVDADGRLDFVVRAEPDVDEEYPNEAIFILVSAAKGDRIRTLPAVADRSSLRDLVRPAGDVDADGTPDLLIRYPDGESPGVEVISGRTAERLAYLGQASKPGMSSSASGIGDVDGDGHDDVAVGSPGFEGTTPDSIVVVSGATTRPLYAVADPVRFGHHSIARLGDTNHDDVADWVSALPGISHCRLLVVSGSDGRMLVELSEQDMRWGDNCCVLMRVLRAGEDVDGDGIPDVLVRLFFGPVEDLRGAVVYSGADGHEIHRVEVHPY